jgi:flagellin
MLTIRTNLMSLTAARFLGINFGLVEKSTRRLASGLRIASAADDPAGLAVRELIRADVRSLRQRERNTRDGISLAQTAEGALGKINDILVRMRELVEQAATDTYSDAQKNIMQQEYSQLGAEITRIARSTKFNDIALLDNDDEDGLRIHCGGEGIELPPLEATGGDLGVTGQQVEVEIDTPSAPTMNNPSDPFLYNGNAMAPADLEISVSGYTATLTFAPGESLSFQQVVDGLNVSSSAQFGGWNIASLADGKLVLTGPNNEDVNFTVANPPGFSIGYVGSGGVTVQTAHLNVRKPGSNDPDLIADNENVMQKVDDAIDEVSQQRARFGYLINRLEHAGSVLQVEAENLLAAESRISDVDVAVETARMTRYQVLIQAGISMLSQANQMPQMALQLLQ